MCTNKSTILFQQKWTSAFCCKSIRFHSLKHCFLFLLNKKSCLPSGTYSYSIYVHFVRFNLMGSTRKSLRIFNIKRRHLFLVVKLQTYVFSFIEVPLFVLGHCVDGLQRAAAGVPPTYCVWSVFQAAALRRISSLLHLQLLSTKRPRRPQPTQTQHLVSMDMQAFCQK